MVCKTAVKIVHTISADVISLSPKYKEVNKEQANKNLNEKFKYSGVERVKITYTLNVYVYIVD